MGFGVFIHRSDSIYDDSPAEQYQFPSQYLRRVEACIGDWIIYYEPSKVAETRGYFAIARVQQVIPDPAISGMYLALIEPGSYLDFANPVSFNGPTGPVERGVLNEQGRISGRAQAAVRPISPDDFNRICELGLAESAPLLPRRDGDVRQLDLNETQMPFRFEQQRDRVSLTVSRILRDRVFRRVVLRAYDERCAITGLKLINGMGRAEVAAAHIRPVDANGPDIINNGVALSGTAHWMFDRGLISLADNLEILISRQTNDLDGVRSMINKTGHAIAPQRASDHPHPHFLRWHREHCFKQ
ncbi:HNH endonuclease [Bradyrhizobium diazoefficiens]|jgi:putative restriction endonuclease|nr:HNH endonuclease [Bradyrhizobium diazoefficiens]MBR0962794.1 HNH endonuclease [Bradyrhizobium diazoefficiens]MBR0976954.1 HNH endonuclease [Bradyrhizobium diazoefficiens]MBR1005599.1 HNH endonuclease [Bradyrhizobium diazoefficiens]MBR1012072.1 HNH endonuclease [Bradyrhizobium diazoefficiens]MBR1049413.1 HNH endonuclease [Bradyrhizobium diazoefficiens]